MQNYRRQRFAGSAVQISPRWFLPILALVVGSCQTCPPPAPPATFTGCIDFESLPLGTEYRILSDFSDSGAVLTVQAFQWDSGDWTTGNFARVDNSGQAGASGQDLAVNNVNLSFDFGVPSVTNVSFAFGEYGGNLNIKINGEFLNFENFDEIDGRTIGGTAISVANGHGDDSGMVKIEGEVRSLTVGGQELWLDHVCVG